LHMALTIAARLCDRRTAAPFNESSRPPSRDPYAVSSLFRRVAAAFRHQQGQGLWVPAQGRDDVRKGGADGNFSRVTRTGSDAIALSAREKLTMAQRRC